MSLFRIGSDHIGSLYTYDPKTKIGREVKVKLTVKNNIICAYQVISVTEQDPHDFKRTVCDDGVRLDGTIRKIRWTGDPFESYWPRVMQKSVDYINEIHEKTIYKMTAHGKKQ